MPPRTPAAGHPGHDPDTIGGEHVRTPKACPFDLAFEPPSRHRLVIPAQENLRHLAAPVDAGAGEMGTVEQPVPVGATYREGVLPGGVLVAQRVRQQSDHRVDQEHRGDLAARDHEIAHADLLRLENLDRPLIDPLVVAGDQQEPRQRRKLVDPCLVQRPPLRRQEDAVRRGGVERLDGLDGVDERLAHHDHAGTAAERSIIHLAVLVVGVCPDVVQIAAHEARLDRAAHDARADDALEHGREQRKDVDAEGERHGGTEARRHEVKETGTRRASTSCLGAFVPSCLFLDQLLPGRRVAVKPLQERADRPGRLGADAQPVVDAIDVDAELLVVGGDRVEPPQLLDHAAVARASAVHRAEAIERAMAATKALQSENNHDARTPCPAPASMAAINDQE
jgi:hypothetical protein